MIAMRGTMIRPVRRACDRGSMGHRGMNHEVAAILGLFQHGSRIVTVIAA